MLTRRRLPQHTGLASAVLAAARVDLLAYEEDLVLRNVRVNGRTRNETISR